jgi:hypothetical protein
MQGIPLAVLTDGQRWNFYLPSGQGTYNDRRFYSLDLLEREPSEIEQRLKRYLEWRNIQTGDALRHASDDYQDRSRQREIKQVLPVAWKELLLDADEWLVIRLVDKVEALTGFKPPIESVIEFLRGEITPHTDTASVTEIRPVASVETVRHLQEDHTNAQGRPQQGGTWYRIGGVTQQHRNGVELMIAILRDLAQRDTSFLSRFAEREHGRNRRWIAQDKYQLYQRRDLCEEYSRELVANWWVGTNYSNSNKRQIIEAAIETAGLALDREFSYQIE